MDELDDLLTPHTVVTPFNDVAWTATTRVLRRRRWWRRGRSGLMMVVCFVAGALLVYRPSAPNAIAPADNVMAVQPKPAETPIESPPHPMDTPRRLERWAKMAEGEKQRTLYRRAGDAYLNYGDEVAAYRCYEKVLLNGAPTDVVFNPQDSWMLMSMKIARIKE